LAKRNESKPHLHKPRPRQVTVADLTDRQRQQLWVNTFPVLLELKQKARLRMDEAHRHSIAGHIPNNLASSLRGHQ
jgi:hypothetical protein